MPEIAGVGLTEEAGQGARRGQGRQIPDARQQPRQDQPRARRLREGHRRRQDGPRARRVVHRLGRRDDDRPGRAGDGVRRDSPRTSPTPATPTRPIRRRSRRPRWRSPASRSTFKHGRLAARSPLASALPYLAGLGDRRADAVLDAVGRRHGVEADRGGARHRSARRSRAVRACTTAPVAPRVEGRRPQEPDDRAARAGAALGAALRRWRQPPRRSGERATASRLFGRRRGARSDGALHRQGQGRQRHPHRPGQAAARPAPAKSPRGRSG